MARRSRRFSSISADESEDGGGGIKYIPERSALKSTQKGGDPDDWPCYVLEDTTIYMKDGKTIGNLLNAELDTFVVRGRLVVDVEWRSRLINKKMNGEYIEIPSCEGFSIGSGPITLWAQGQSGWLEIQPSEEYQDMYNKMSEAISIYFFVADLYEKMQGSKIPLSIDSILLKYAIHEGTGLVRSEAVERMKSHAEFLLSQMRKGESVVWSSTLFFKWLSAECHEIYTKLTQKTGERVPPRTRIGLTVLPAPIPQVPQLQPQPTHELKALPHHSRRPIPPSTRSRPKIDLPSPVTTSRPTDTLSEAEAPLPLILHLMQSADADGSSPRAKMTLSKLGTLFYYKYSIKSAPLSQEIIKLHAKAILSSLGTEWKATPVFEQLRDSASRPSLDNDLRTLAISVTEVKKRREACTFRKVRSCSTGSSRRRLAGRETDDLTPESHASKSLLPPQSGRRSGKEAGLRLVSSPAQKRDVDTSSDEDTTSRLRKRRRLSPPEIGDESDSPPLISHDSPSSTLSSPNLKPAALSLKMTAEALPTLSPSGPNGSWSCDRKDCIFVVREADSEEGKERIQTHYSEHANRLEREDLVRQEAAQRRLPIDHLLEKLRGLGESARIDGMAGVIAGRVGERGMVV